MLTVYRNGICVLIDATSTNVTRTIPQALLIVNNRDAIIGHLTATARSRERAERYRLDSIPHVYMTYIPDLSLKVKM
jgi:hypothetical protein